MGRSIHQPGADLRGGGGGLGGLNPPPWAAQKKKKKKTTHDNSGYNCVFNCYLI